MEDRHRIALLNSTNRARFQAELDHPDLEVVLLEVASLDDLKRTHRRYFEDLAGFLQPA